MEFLPIVSFIIPTFNRAAVLPGAINSLINQTSSNWELLVVDDGSTDSTIEVVTKFQEDERINLIKQAHQGVSVARNFGAKRAKGSYLVFLDSDDSLDPELLQQVNNIRFWEYDLIFWDVMKKQNERKILWKPRELGKIYNNIKGSFLAGSLCLKKSVFFEAGKYDPKISYGENYELGLRICQILNLKIAYLEKPLLTYFVGNQDRHDKFPKRLDSHLHQYKKHKELYLAHPVANAEMLRIIGFMYEKMNKKVCALEYYKQSFLVFPYRLKTLLKIIYLKVSN